MKNKVPIVLWIALVLWLVVMACRSQTNIIYGDVTDLGMSPAQVQVTATLLQPSLKTWNAHWVRPNPIQRWSDANGHFEYTNFVGGQYEFDIAGSSGDPIVGWLADGATGRVNVLQFPATTNSISLGGYQFGAGTNALLTTNNGTVFFNASVTGGSGTTYTNNAGAVGVIVGSGIGTNQNTQTLTNTATALINAASNAAAGSGLVANATYATSAGSAALASVANAVNGTLTNSTTGNAATATYAANGVTPGQSNVLASAVTNSTTWNIYTNPVGGVIAYHNGQYYNFSNSTTAGFAEITALTPLQFSNPFVLHLLFGQGTFVSHSPWLLTNNTSIEGDSFSSTTIRFDVATNLFTKSQVLAAMPRAASVDKLTNLFSIGLIQFCPPPQNLMLNSSGVGIGYPTANFWIKNIGITTWSNLPCALISGSCDNLYVDSSAIGWGLSSTNSTGNLQVWPAPYSPSLVLGLAVNAYQYFTIEKSYVMGCADGVLNLGNCYFVMDKTGVGCNGYVAGVGFTNGYGGTWLGVGAGVYSMNNCYNGAIVNSTAFGNNVDFWNDGSGPNNPFKVVNFSPQNSAFTIAVTDGSISAMSVESFGSDKNQNLINGLVNVDSWTTTIFAADQSLTNNGLFGYSESLSAGVGGFDQFFNYLQQDGAIPVWGWAGMINQGQFGAGDALFYINGLYPLNANLSLSTNLPVSAITGFTNSVSSIIASSNLVSQTRLDSTNALILASATNIAQTVYSNNPAHYFTNGSSLNAANLTGTIPLVSLPSQVVTNSMGNVSITLNGSIIAGGGISNGATIYGGNLQAVNLVGTNTIGSGGNALNINSGGAVNFASGALVNGLQLPLSSITNAGALASQNTVTGSQVVGGVSNLVAGATVTNLVVSGTLTTQNGTNFSVDANGNGKLGQVVLSNNVVGDANTTYTAKSITVGSGGMTVSGGNVICPSFLASSGFTFISSADSISADSSGKTYKFKDQSGFVDIYISSNSVTAPKIMIATNGFASYATNTATIGSTGWTNNLNPLVTAKVWLTAATALALYDCKGTNIFTGQTIAALTELTVQPSGYFTGTAITAAGNAHAQ